jgi:serine/threonine protein kinase
MLSLYIYSGADYMQEQDIFCHNCGASNQQNASICFACSSSLAITGKLPEEITPPLSQTQILQQRYSLLQKIGEGGFSSVYKAEDMQTNTIVALKAIDLRGLTTSEKIEATDAFNREVQMLTKLDHRNLPHLYDHFSDTECWYMAMELIEGTTLEKRLERRKGTPLPVEEVLDISLVLCYVLAYLHSHNPAIIFRDLKPANIMLTRQGHLFLIDFGIARHYKPGQRSDTIPFGSPGYAPPEQYGKAQTTPRTDIYSLGAIMHQLLTGTDPSHTPFIFAPLADQQRPELATLNTLIQHMVRMNPDQRPDNIDTVKHELQMIATQYTFQRGLYSNVSTGSNQSPQPATSQPGAVPPSWTSSTQSAVAGGMMMSQLQAPLFYMPHQLNAQHQQQAFINKTPTNWYALASLLSGLLGVFVPPLFCSVISIYLAERPSSTSAILLYFVLLLPSIMGIIFGYTGKHYARTMVGNRVGKDIATAGLAISYAFGILYLLFLVSLFFISMVGR